MTPPASRCPEKQQQEKKRAEINRSESEIGRRGTLISGIFSLYHPSTLIASCILRAQENGRLPLIGQAEGNNFVFEFIRE
ncbi:hypothetical protein CEXT_333741 [Caerostris extrusa]|uniref:Uncharacterized protein n=1 Tax=Caerostris extrusa TaxID=172846 RepID=A0AAV4TU05_CAEEX|nr:hypothetical protein CEXT_333741 [Caerostris extrusa]